MLIWMLVLVCLRMCAETGGREGGGGFCGDYIFELRGEVQVKVIVTLISTNLIGGMCDL